MPELDGPKHAKKMRRSASMHASLDRLGEKPSEVPTRARGLRRSGSLQPSVSVPDVTKEERVERLKRSRTTPALEASADQQTAAPLPRAGSGESIVPPLMSVTPARAAKKRSAPDIATGQAVIPTATLPGVPRSAHGSVYIGVDWSKGQGLLVFLSGEEKEVLRDNFWLRRDTLHGLITYMQTVLSKASANRAEEHHVLCTNERYLPRFIFALGLTLACLAAVEYIACMGVLRVGVASACAVVLMTVGVVMAICFRQTIPRHWLDEADDMARRHAAQWTSCHNSFQSEADGTPRDGMGPELRLVYHSRELAKLDLESQTAGRLRNSQGDRFDVACYFELTMVPLDTNFSTEVSVDDWTRIPSPTLPTLPSQRL
mmetsp:Transcript_70200/g.131253  ORF Transcript_70200/g.131253 Transcript_70200/m.131253 type:complete len:373 (-) Transcript_70200:130-1248(-)